MGNMLGKLLLLLLLLFVPPFVNRRFILKNRKNKVSIRNDLTKANALKNKKNFSGKNRAFKTIKGSARIAKLPNKYFMPVNNTIEIDG